jgi:hypothetical protein
VESGTLALRHVMLREKSRMSAVFPCGGNEPCRSGTRPSEKVAGADPSVHKMRWANPSSGVVQLRRRDLEIIEIGEGTSLGALMERLQSLYDRLSENAEAQVKVRGDDNFGGRLTVMYFRDLTAEEAKLEGRYASRVAGRKPPFRFFADQARS